MSVRAVVPWALSAASGLLVWLGFAGVDLWPLALVAFVPFFFALERGARVGGGRACLLGLLFGGVAMACGYHWLLATLQRFSGLPAAGCLALAVLFWLHHGGQLALFGWLWWRARRAGAPAALAAPVAFAAVELCYPRVFPAYYGASFHPVPLALQIAELGGPILLGALCLATNGALYELCAAWHSGEARRSAVAVAGCVALALVYGAVRMPQVERAAQGAPHLRVGIVQPNMGASAKWSRPREGQRRLVEASRALEASVRPDLIVWPETAYAAGLPARLERVPGAVTGGLQSALLFGSVARLPAQGGEPRVLNRVYLVAAGGELRGSYDKVNLVAFSESLPGADRFVWLRRLSPRRAHFVPGSHVRPLPFREFRISALVCFEDVLPRFVRRVMREASPHLLVNLTNDAWFGDTHEPWIHLALAQLRAVEQRRYLVRATNSGVSAVIDPLGRVVVRSGAFTRETLHAEVAMLQGRTPYQVLGDWPGWLSLAAILWLAFLRRPSADGG